MFSFRPDNSPVGKNETPKQTSLLFLRYFSILMAIISSYPQDFTKGQLGEQFSEKIFWNVCQVRIRVRQLHNWNLLHTGI
jgi:hypothetical protein